MVGPKVRTIIFDYRYSPAGTEQLTGRRSYSESGRTNEFGLGANRQRVKLSSRLTLRLVLLPLFKFPAFSILEAGSPV